MTAIQGDTLMHKIQELRTQAKETNDPALATELHRKARGLLEKLRRGRDKERRRHIDFQNRIAKAEDT